jgi:hypothetical protein
VGNAAIIDGFGAANRPGGISEHYEIERAKDVAIDVFRGKMGGDSVAVVAD